MSRFLFAYVGLLAGVAALAVAGGVALFQATGPSDAIEAAADAHGYNVVSWELRHFPEKWLYKTGHLFDERSRSEEDDVLRRYFSLVQDIQRLEREPEAANELKTVEDERANIENEVEDVIEGRVTAVLEDEGLTMGPPPFTEMRLVFPPVDFEFDSPPRVLVVSPRERIEYDRSYLLTPGLNVETAEGIEREAEAENAGESGVSALVVSTGGVATYPNVVPELDSYDSLIDTVFHEWLHSYLAFYPLGSSYFSGDEARTLNESVTNLAGHELARLYFERYGALETGPSLAPPPSTSPAPAPAFDFTKAMRELRRQVEDLLSQGRVAEAEALMNEKREEFEGRGYYIRRLNQAYFAFHGSYADTPGSIDPIGPKLERLLERAGSAGEFVRRARSITSEAGLDGLLAGT